MNRTDASAPPPAPAPESAATPAALASQPRARLRHVDARVPLHQTWSLWLVLVSLTFGWVLLPFHGTVLWGAIVALMFAPLSGRLAQRLGGRRTLAALLTLLIVLLMVVLPLMLLTASLAQDAAVIYQQLQSGELNPGRYFRGLFDALPDWLTRLLDRYGLVNFEALQKRLVTLLEQGSQLIAGQAFSIGQNTVDFLASLFITLYLAFFLVRDGDALVAAIQRAIPLEASHKQRLLETFTTVVRATVKGNLLVALIQGACGGLAFWFLDVGGALPWAVLMGFLSLLPAIGASLVWVPVAAYLFVSGEHWQAIALASWGVLVIGLVDNLLRPVLVGKDTRMPDYVVMISTLGGISTFGIHGFVLGPAIAAMFIASWQLRVDDSAHDAAQDAAEQAVHDAAREAAQRGR
ncbi:MAG: AI-2E family transporter [Leptothrix sp. (in: b-proteobacteria)]